MNDKTLLQYAYYEDIDTLIIEDFLVYDFKVFYKFLDYKNLKMELKIQQVIFIQSLQDVAEFIKEKGEEFCCFSSIGKTLDEIQSFIKSTKVLCKYYGIEKFYFDDVDILLDK